MVYQRSNICVVSELLPACIPFLSCKILWVASDRWMGVLTVNTPDSLSFFFFFFFFSSFLSFFLTCLHKRGLMIRTSNFRFIKCVPSQLSYVLGILFLTLTLGSRILLCNIYQISISYYKDYGWCRHLHWGFYHTSNIYLTY
jgi:hypothetical protein